MHIIGSQYKTRSKWAGWEVNFWKLNIFTSKIKWACTLMRKRPDGSVSPDILNTTPIKSLFKGVESYLRLHSDMHVTWETFEIILAPTPVHPVFYTILFPPFLFIEFVFGTEFCKKLKSKNWIPIPKPRANLYEIL